MIFATKDRFCINLLLYRKIGQIQFHIIKRHNSDYFDITRKINRNREIGRLIWRIMETNFVVGVTMTTVYVDEERNILYIDGRKRPS